MTACAVCGGAGFVEHHEQVGALVPCKRCRPKAFDRWGLGKYSSTIDRESAMEQARRPLDAVETAVW